jgi:hypothetical protein
MGLGAVMDDVGWTAGDVAAILVNPFYAVNIHPSLAEPHPCALTESQWLAANSTAISRLGPRRWLDAMLSALVARHGARRRSLHELPVGDPYDAITVSHGLCVRHEPLIKPEVWVQANVRTLEQEPAEVWLGNLLAVLKGAYVA